MRARELMTENPSCVTPGKSLQDAARMMRDEDVGIVPVVEDMDSKRLRGVVTDRDITVRCVAEGKHDATVGDCMTSDVRSVKPDSDVDEIIKIMQEDRIRRVMVVDNDKIVGVVAQADLARAAERDKDLEKKMDRALESISQPA